MARRFLTERTIRHIVKNVLLEIRELLEGLVSTYDSDKVVGVIKRMFSLTDDEIGIESRLLYGNDEIKSLANGELKLSPEEISKRKRGGRYVDTINITLDPGDRRILGINQYLQKYGYFLSWQGVSQNDMMKRLYRYEPKIQPEYKNFQELDVKQTEKYLYHITTASNYEKIRKIGLCPRYNNSVFRFPERIYLLKGSTPDLILRKAVESLKRGNEGKLFQYRINPYTKDSKYQKYKVLVIDTEKIPKYAKFYLDPNTSQYGLFTYTNIPKDAIIGEKDLNEHDENKKI